MQWSVRPFVRIILFFIPGILLGSEIVDFRIDIFSIILLSSILLFSGFVIAKWLTSYKLRWFGALVFYVSVFMFGVFISYQSSRQIAMEEVSDHSNSFVGEIVSDPVQTKNAIRLEIATSSEEGKDAYSKFKVLAYLEKSDASLNLVYGDKIVFEANLKKNKNSGNPGEFDYAIYLNRKGIVYTTYLNNKQWSFLLYSPSNKLMAFAKRLRQSLLHKLEETSVFDNTYEVSAAILLGYDFLMDAETEQDFVRAGAMHILCVSGLHVGVIFLIMSFLLNFLKTNALGKYIRIVLLLLSVWSYAMLTGLSPSVLRASIMLSFFIMGEASNRLKDSYNTLAASAFAMLLIDPMLIYSVGFQLSYAAVLGIISIYRPVYNLFYFKNKLINYLWSILSVSIAAQIATFPIATHYFHYFPTYFWLVNLFVIPLSFLIIMSGFVFFVVSWIPFLSTAFGAITSFLVYLLNNAVGLVELFPLHGFDNIFMPWAKLILVYLIIIASFHLLFFKRILLLKYLTLLVLVLLVFNTVVKYQNLTRKEVVAFNVKKHNVLEFINGTEVILFSDSVFFSDQNLHNFTLRSNHINCGIEGQQVFNTDIFDSYTNKNIFVDGSFLGFYNKKYLILNSNDSLFKSQDSKMIDVDAVIISGKKSIDIDELRQCVIFNKIIISSSVPYWKQKLIANKCKEAGINCSNINKDGAFIENIYF